MGLLDRLGTGMAGTMPYDPAMLQGLGLDPEAMQRERSRMAMLQFLAGLGGAKAKGGASFGQALNEGLSAALQYRAGQQGQETNQLYMLQNMKRTQAADEAARAESARDAELAAQLNSDEFWQQAPPELAQYRPILSKLPPRQAAQLLAQTQQQIGADKRQQALFGQQAAMQEDRQAAQEALAAQRQAAMLAAIGARGAGAPQASETERLMALLSDPAYAPDTEQGQALRAKLGLGSGTNNRGTAGVQQVTAKDAKELHTGLGAMTDIRQTLLEAKRNLESGKLKTGTTKFSWLADTAPQFLSSEEKTFLRNVNQGWTQKAKLLPGSLTEREGLGLKLSGLNVTADNAANLRTIDEALISLDRAAAQANERLELFQKGGTILDVGPRDPESGARAPTGQGRDHYPYPQQLGGGQPPEEGPPGAVRGPDGSWIDPKTGRKYEWVP